MTTRPIEVRPASRAADARSIAQAPDRVALAAIRHRPRDGVTLCGVGVLRNSRLTAEESRTAVLTTVRADGSSFGHDRDGVRPGTRGHALLQT
jgi:hypothetical protein